MVAATSKSVIKTKQGMSVSGALTFSSVTEVLSQGSECIEQYDSQKDKSFEIDCAAMQRLDSAGIALLIEWQRQCLKADISSHFVGLLDQPKSLIKAYQLESLIPA